jgi:hypothetical protein
MNTLQIQHALQNVANFGGVFPSDMLPSKFNRPTTFIVNLDPHNKPGSHWVAVTFRDKYSAWYFDSYGLPPIVESLERFLRRNTVHYTYNQRQLQSISSDICGQYACLYTVYVCSKSYNMKGFTTIFNYKDADNQAVRMYRQEFGEMLAPGCRDGQTCLRGVRVSTSPVLDQKL